MTARKPGSTRIEQERHGLFVGTTRQPPEYRAWAQIIQRCTNPNEAAFKNYGGRGISVCERWRTSYTAFFADVGARPSPKHSIDRIDNDGNYEPGNVRWATRREQNANHRRNRLVTVDNITEPLTHACERRGFNVNTIRHRMDRKGLTAAEAFALGAPRR